MPEATPRRHGKAMTIRFTDAELESLDDAAQALGVTRTTLIRMMARNARFLAVAVPPVQPAGEE